MAIVTYDLDDKRGLIIDGDLGGRCISWQEIAQVLWANGYHYLQAGDKTGLVSPKIARIGVPEWSKAGMTAHHWRASVAEKVWGFPEVLGQYLPNSDGVSNLAYVKSNVVHPKDGKFTPLWLAHVLKVNETTDDEPQPKNHTDEIIEYLKEMGYCRLGYFKKGNIRLNRVACIDRPDWGEIMQKLPRDTLPAHYYRKHYSREILIGLPENIYKALPHSEHSRIGYTQ